MDTKKTKLLGLIDKLIKEGYEVAAMTVGTSEHVEMYRQQSAKFRGGIANLLRVLGSQGSHWAGAFQRAEPLEMVGTLEAIKETMEGDYLVTMEELVFAEAFADLIEQAEYLLTEGYFLAAGVLGRAVLEEHLRKWATNVGCTFARNRPTLGDYVLELAKAGKLNKAEAKHADALTAVGNLAAHNDPALKREQVEGMIPNVAAFIAQHPIA